MRLRLEVSCMQCLPRVEQEALYPKQAPKEQETQSAAVCVDSTRTSALFEGHRAVGERRGLAHAFSGREDPPGLPPVHGAGAGRLCRGVRALAGVQRLRGQVFARAPCRTSASVRCHARGLWGELSLGVFPFSSRSPRRVFCRGDESPGAPGAGTILGSGESSQECETHLSCL